jgi:hypothetical protein
VTGVPGRAVIGAGAGSKARRAPFSMPRCVIRTTVSSNTVARVSTSAAASVSSVMPLGSAGIGIA